MIYTRTTYKSPAANGVSNTQFGKIVITGKLPELDASIFIF